MTTEEKIAKLSTISILVANPVYSEDLGMQYDIMTGIGSYTEMGSVGQWPFMRFKVSDDLRALQKALLSGSILTDETLLKNDTIKEICTYHSFIYGNYLIENEPLSNCLNIIREGLKKVDLSIDDLFAFVSLEEWDIDIRFYASYDQLTLAVKEVWGDSVEPYGEMDEDDIDYWYDVAEKNGWYGVPYASFGYESN